MTGSMIKRPFMILIIILSILLHGASLLYGQTNLYVSPEGSDAIGDGSMQAPFRTLGFAASEAQPGDSVFIMAGIYRNQGFGDNNIWSGNNLEKITANGTAYNYITLLPNPGDEVLFEFDATYGVLVYNSSYLRIVGLEIKGINDQITYEEAISAWGLYKDQNGVVHDLASEMGINLDDPDLLGQEIAKPSMPDIKKPSYYNGRGLVANKSHHIEFINNIVHDCPSSAIRVQQSDFVTVKGNEVYNSTWWTSQGVGAITVAEATNVSGDDTDEIKISLLQNEVYANENRLISWNPTKTFVKFVIDEGTGLFLTRNKDTYAHGRILIANNLSYNNGASGIVCHVTNNAIIEHNTVVNNGTTNTGSAGGIGVNNSDNVIIRNNISYSRMDKWALGKIAEPVTNLQVEKNIVFNNNGSEEVTNKVTEGWEEADPQFVDLTDLDFTLFEDSPCIDNGSTNTVTSIDFLGRERGDGLPDIGAIEFDNVTEVVLLNNKNGNKIGIYPNPNNGTFTISDLNPSSIILCTDLNGKKVNISVQSQSEGLATIEINNRLNGFYLLYLDEKVIKMVVNNN